jgi:alpha-L-fucosidase
VKNRERITDEDYQKYFDHFDPDLFDPQAWADEAWNAGMRYFVVTTKHHEGFALWDSDLTDYKATRTPYGKDLIGPMVEAFRGRGHRVGFYHSVIDWHHPEFPVDSVHPRRDDEEYKAANADRDITKYAEYLHGQVRELLTRYGKVDVMWYDFSYPQMPGGKGRDDWQSETLDAMTRELQPGILVNDRLDLDNADLTTPEQVQPVGNVVTPGEGPQLWEACQTLNGSWGYDRDNHDWKSPGLIIRMLIDTVSKGGNMLLNVGPNARGQWERRAVETLRGVGQWMQLHERAIRGNGPSGFTPPADARYTQKGNRLYLHLFAWPFGMVHLPGLAGKVEYAQFLHDASEVFIVDAPSDGHISVKGLAGDVVSLRLPSRAPDVEVPVIELFLKD